VLLKKNKTIEGQTVTTATKGLATGSWTRVPTTTAEVKAETTSILYDYKYRPIRTYTTNYLGGYTNTDSKLDSFSGLLQYTLQKHKRTANDAELTVKEAFTYSPQKRLLTHTHQINGGAEQLLADNSYDELGKLTSKKVGNSSATPLQKVDYSYNIRGWLTKINEIGSLQQGTDPADLFSFKLNYNTVDGSTSAASPLYNGNIAETFWRTATDGGFVRNYGYKYDNLNRLKDATYQKSGQLTNMYNENLSYDKNGNIMNLSRNGDRDEQYLPIQIDNLEYGYATNSNKLMSVVDNSNNTSGFKDGITTGDDYVYDANGNMTVDKNKNITAITYNHLNLPTKIIFTTGNIVYIYTASGQKMQKIVTDGTNTTNTDYLGGYQYQNTVLQFFPTAEGYVKNTPVSGTNSYSYVFNYTDHLGNTRLSYTKDAVTGSLKILEENNYYPFGLKHNSYNVDNFQPDYKYKFEGREYQDELGLNVYPFKYRTYDPAIGRFWSIDPVAENYVYNGVYNFAENRVVESIDLEGKESWFTQDGSLATKAGPYTSQARQKLNLYSPSEVQQMKAQRSSNTGPMLSQDRLSPQQRNNQERLAKTTHTSTPTKTAETSHKTIPEKIGEAAKGVSEVAEKTSTATKVTAVIVGAVAAFTGQEYVVPAAVDAYMGGMAIGSVGQVAKGVSLSTQEGKGTEAALEFGSVLASEVTGGWVDKIPGVSDVTKITAKTAVEAAIETGKEKTKEKLEKH
jgi:RHS repeat-associated protein